MNNNATAIPHNYEACLTNNCPQREHCLRAWVWDNRKSSVQRYVVLNPDLTTSDGHCPFYCDDQPQRYASASQTSNVACTLTNTNNSCRHASPASAVILISCAGVEIRLCHPLSKRSYVVYSSKSEHPKISTSMVLRNRSTGMATKA